MQAIHGGEIGTENVAHGVNQEEALAVCRGHAGFPARGRGMESIADGKMGCGEGRLGSAGRAAGTIGDSRGVRIYLEDVE